MQRKIRPSCKEESEIKLYKIYKLQHDLLYILLFGFVYIKSGLTKYKGFFCFVCLVFFFVFCFFVLFRFVFNSFTH